MGRPSEGKRKVSTRRWSLYRNGYELSDCYATRLQFVLNVQGGFGRHEDVPPTPSIGRWGKGGCYTEEGPLRFALRSLFDVIGIPWCLCWPSGFLEAWGTKANNHKFPGTYWFWPPSAAKPFFQKTIPSSYCWSELHTFERPELGPSSRVASDE